MKKNKTALLEVLIALVIVILLFLPQIIGTTTVSDSAVGVNEEGYPVTELTLEIVENRDGSKVESASIEKENGDFAVKTVVTDKDGKTSEESSSKSTDEKTGAVTETKSTVEADGSSTDYGKVTQANNDFEEAYIEKDKDGNVVKSEESSRVTDPETKAVTETEKKTDENGVSESTITTQTNGDYESMSKITDSSGNLLEEATGSKKSEANGDVEEKKEVKDGSGKVLESYEASQKTDTSGAVVTEYEKSINRDGSSFS